MKRYTKILASAALLSSSVLVTLFLVEILLRLFVPIRLVGPSVTSYHPFYGHTNKTNFSSRQITPEFTWHFTFNSLGHRGPEPDPSAGKRILYLGDSFTVGLGVDDDEVYPMLVQEGLQQRAHHAIPFANAAIGNSGQGRWVKILRVEASDIQPCLVVLQILENDFSDNLREDLFQLQPDGSLEEQPIYPPGRGRRIQDLGESIPGLTRTYLYGLLRQAYHARTTGGGSGSGGESPERKARREAREDSLTYRLLEEAATLIHHGGWPAISIVVDLPLEREAPVLEILRRYGIPAETIPGKDVRPNFYYPIDGHWNQNGHREAAEKVLTMLSEHLPPDCGN